METEIKKNVEEFLNKAGLSFNNVSSDLDMDSGVFTFSIESPDSNYLIGKNGDNLFNISYLIKRIVDKKYGENAPKISIDVNNYQKSKAEKIKTIAHMMSERARFFKSRVELEPMNAFERRVVHEYVSHHKDLKSESAGFGPQRHVVISFVKE